MHPLYNLVLCSSTQANLWHTSHWHIELLSCWALCSYCAVTWVHFLKGCPFCLPSPKLPLIYMGNVSSPFKNFLKLAPDVLIPYQSSLWATVIFVVISFIPWYCHWKFMSVSHHGLKWLCRRLRGSNLVEGGQGDLSLRYIGKAVFYLDHIYLRWF